MTSALLSALCPHVPIVSPSPPAARRYDAYLIGAGTPELPTAEHSFRTMLRGAGVVGDRVATRAVHDALRSRAVHIGADFIVMGAYGRPRLREVILGGMMHDVIENVTVPVLMTH